MKRIRITHLTEYHYAQPVTLGPHRVLVRPREGHDVHIESSKLRISPTSSIRWLRDMVGNSIANVTFDTPSDKLSIFSEVVVANYQENPLDFDIDPSAITYPFRYAMDEQAELIPYRLSTYPNDGTELQDWLADFYQPGQLVGTFDLLSSLNQAISRRFTYRKRDEPGVQPPARTLALGTGSCRDFAALLMEAARTWGFGARFVSGYLETPVGDQHGATHAWTEIYIPGAGWRGFDPTNNTYAGSRHVSVAVSRDPEKAAPVAGTWTGPAGSAIELNIQVTVVQI